MNAGARIDLLMYLFLHSAQFQKGLEWAPVHVIRLMDEYSGVDVGIKVMKAALPLPQVGVALQSRAQTCSLLHGSVPRCSEVCPETGVQ